MKKQTNPELNIWIYGINSISSLLQTHGRNIEKIWFSRTKNDQRIQKLCEQARLLGISCAEQHVQKLDELAESTSHQNIVAFCKLPAYLGEHDIDRLCETDAPIFLILDRVTDPGNFGACLRTAEICGITAVIIPSDHSVGLTPVVVKAASGAVGRVRIVRVPNIVRVIKRMQEKGIWVIASNMSAESQLYEIDCLRPTAFVLGSEGKGIRRLVAETCDHSAMIPMYGKVGSFNVSAAAAVLLYEVCRQRALSGID